MRLTVIFSALALVISAAGLTHSARAGELDNEASVTNIQQRQLAAELPGTVVVRIKDADQSISVLHSNDILPARQLQLPESKFVSMKADGSMSGPAKNELDRDSSTNSWFFYFNRFNCYHPVYNYWGYNFYYQPYYNSYWGGYHYYYYWYRWW